MTVQKLHIVSFDIPYPADYGGVIDVFYKLKALHRAGVKIHLHCFEYHRGPSPILSEICEEVHYYPRQTEFKATLNVKPYIVASRKSPMLLENLLKDDSPILFEGLHSCYYLSHKALQGRKKIYRESNIEHHYYWYLFKAERAPWKKLFFLLESFKLRMFQFTLKHASLFLTVSKEDTAYLQKMFPGKRVEYLPSFHRDDAVSSQPGKGAFALYQGKLSVPENSRAAEFLMIEVWTPEMPGLVIAGMDPPERMKKIAALKPNIRIVGNPTDEQMFELIRTAHVNILVTFQPTGLKLKLLNALFNGRFCLINPEMVAGTSLGDLCIEATSPLSFRESVERIFTLEFTPGMILERQVLLGNDHNNQKNCKRLMEILTL